MIFDYIQNLSKYHIAHAPAILKFIAANDCLTLPDGEMEIDGRNLFVRIMSYNAKPASQQRFEAHAQYADVQYIVQGVELMQVVASDQLEALTDQDVKGDIQFFKANQFLTDLIVRPGQCAVFFPGEAHRPACQSVYSSAPIKKLVFKLKY